MRTAIIIERHEFSLTGTQRGVYELASALTRAGIQVDIIAATGRTQTRNIKILCPGKRHPSLSECSAAARAFTSEHNYDIIHSMLPLDFADVFQPPAGSCADNPLRTAASRKPWLARWNRVVSWLDLRRLAMLRAEKALCLRPDGPVIVAPSAIVLDRFRCHYALDEARLALIPCGIKGRKIDASITDRLRGQVLREFAIQEATNPAIFLFAARNFRLHGLEPLLRAMAAAVPRELPRPPFLVVIGGGKQAHYRLLCARLGISRRVLFLGEISHVAEALDAFDVAVLPTFYSPCSRFILESLAAGKPVITTSANGASERLVARRHGLVLDSPANIDTLADALAHYCSEENVLAASRAIAQDNLADEISIDRHTAALIQLYQSILRRKGNQ